MRMFLAALVVFGGCTRQPSTPVVSGGEAAPEGREMEAQAQAALPYDAKFIDGMIAYARHTRELADVGARRAQRDELRIDAENLRAEQSARIAELENWRALRFGRAKAGMVDLEEAAQNLGVPEYSYGLAWTADPKDLNPKQPDDMAGVATVTGADKWGAKEQLAALKELPEAAFDAYYTAALVEHDRWGMEAASEAAPKLDNRELQMVAQELFTDNLIHLHQVAEWRNDWFGAQTPSLMPPEEEPGTR